METIKKEEFHTIAPDNTDKTKIALTASLVVIALVVIGAYVYVSKTKKADTGPIHITQMQLDAFNKQVASQPAPTYTPKQTDAFNKQVAAQETPAYTPEQMAAFNKQVQSQRPVIVDTK